MMRSIIIWMLFAALVAGVAVAVFNPAPVAAGPLFRVIDVRAEYGHLIIEAQHFYPDGSHWFYENYTFQGREQDNRPRITDELGPRPRFRNPREKGIRRGNLAAPRTRLFLAGDGRVAPTRPDAFGNEQHYLPEGATWLRHNRPHLSQQGMLSVIRSVHRQRTEGGWTKGGQRLTTHPLDATEQDRRGARLLKQRFAGMKAAAFTLDEAERLVAYTGPLPMIDPYVSSAWGTVSTFYPSMDGKAQQSVSDQTWSTLHGAAGNGSSDSGATEYVAWLDAGSVSNRYHSIRRGFFLFDTSGLPDGDEMTSATLDLVATDYQDNFNQSVDIVTTTPASDSGLVNADYTQLGTTSQGTLDLSSITFDSSTFNLIPLNSTGLGNISLTGITKFGTRLSADRTDTEPSWVLNTSAGIAVATSEEVLGGDKRPRLVIAHTSPSAAITGTIGDGATEQEVRDGGGTILITLTGTTWVADGATFNAQRQNIIDGLDSAQSETNGWNAEVRDEMGVSSVVRTSGTIVTVTIAAADVADYRMTSNELITVTVPASAIASADAITATPTFYITAGAESVTISGTLGGSGGTPAEIVAGGETVIITLSNTKWVTSGATFDAERQDIIDGMDSNGSEENGWDAVRSAFAVTDVARTSDTIVTVTLSAASAYAIPSSETITMTVPASAIVYGVALVASPTFAVVPTFAASGNRVIGSIDLSSITDVAYCAIGWQANVPANTTVTVDTSIDGGANYSLATNGSCPTGITPGESLASITDFRMRVNLNTSDSTVTPLVEGLGLLVQDTSGPALYYQLNTIPGVTITDRSANSNAGTMSFPVSQTGVNATTGVLESTRSTLSLEQLLSVGDIVSPVTGAAASSNLFNQTETGFGSLPFQDLMQTMATGGELPLKFIWVVAIGLFSIALGVVALHMTGSLMISGIGLGAGLSIGAAIGGGLIPGWTVILFVILALALVVMRSRGALPL
jgi:hypothetical protein